MARYEHLPIYKSALDLSIYFENIVRNFSRYNKYTIGTELRNKSRQILCFIIKINSLEDKKSALKELILLIEELKIIIRLSKESKAFYNINSYAYSSKLALDISKQAQAWYNHESKQNNPIYTHQ